MAATSAPDVKVGRHGDPSLCLLVDPRFSRQNMYTEKIQEHEITCSAQPQRILEVPDPPERMPTLRIRRRWIDSSGVRPGYHSLRPSPPLCSPGWVDGDGTAPAASDPGVGLITC